MPARSSKSPLALPIGLQIAAKLLDGYDADWSYIRGMLAAADAHARTILRDPIKQLEPEGAGRALTALAESFGAEERALAITTLIPDEATGDPMSLVTSATIPWMNAGLYLGLCLGWRLSGALSEKDGAR